MMVCACFLSVIDEMSRPMRMSTPFCRSWSLTLHGFSMCRPDRLELLQLILLVLAVRVKEPVASMALERSSESIQALGRE